MPLSGEQILNFDQLWDYNEPQETERRFRQLLPKIISDKSSYSQLLTQIARAQGLQRKFDDAHTTLDEVENMFTGDLRAKIRYLLERGRIYNLSKQTDKARPYFLEAWELAQSNHEDFYAVDAAHMLGLTEIPERQLIWNLKALDLAENSPDPQCRTWLGVLFTNIGWVYHRQGDFETALRYFQKALTKRLEEKKPEEIRMAKWCVGRALRSLKLHREAIRIQWNLLSEYERIGEKSGFVYEELAENLLAMDRMMGAKHYFTLAYEELSKDKAFIETRPERFERLKKMGKSSI